MVAFATIGENRRLGCSWQECMRSEQCRCEASSLAGFVQHLAVSCIPHGYFFYVRGEVPEGKDVRAVDLKLTSRYGLHHSKWSRARRKRNGIANIRYARWQRTFVLIATHGLHPFFDEEERNIRDVRRVPLKVFGYSLGHSGGHAHVRIEREEYKRLKAYFLDIAKHRRAEHLADEFRSLPFEPYAPIRRQLLGLLRAVNRERTEAGYELVGLDALRLHRLIVKPFERPSAAQ